MLHLCLEGVKQFKNPYPTLSSKILFFPISKEDFVFCTIINPCKQFLVTAPESTHQTRVPFTWAAMKEPVQSVSSVSGVAVLVLSLAVPGFADCIAKLLKLTNRSLGVQFSIVETHTDFYSLSFICLKCCLCCLGFLAHPSFFSAVIFIC